MFSAFDSGPGETASDTRPYLGHQRDKKRRRYETPMRTKLKKAHAAEAPHGIKTIAGTKRRCETVTPAKELAPRPDGIWRGCIRCGKEFGRQSPMMIYTRECQVLNSAFLARTPELPACVTNAENSAVTPLHVRLKKTIHGAIASCPTENWEFKQNCTFKNQLQLKVIEPF